MSKIDATEFQNLEIIHYRIGSLSENKNSSKVYFPSKRLVKNVSTKFKALEFYYRSKTQILSDKYFYDIMKMENIPKIIFKIQTL